MLIIHFQLSEMSAERIIIGEVAKWAPYWNSAQRGAFSSSQDSLYTLATCPMQVALCTGRDGLRQVFKSPKMQPINYCKGQRVKAQSGIGPAAINLKGLQHPSLGLPLSLSLPLSLYHHLLLALSLKPSRTQINKPCSLRTGAQCSWLFLFWPRLNVMKGEMRSPRSSL